MSQINLGEMTWMEVAGAIEAGCTTVIIPTGSTEQHGPHLPMLTDSIIAEEIGRRLAASLGAIAAPVVSVGCSDHHIGFPGTVTIPEELFIQVVGHHCISMARSGFKRAVIFSAHGGNIPPLERARDRLVALGDEHGVEVLVVGSIHRFAACLNRAMQEGGLTLTSLPHADAGETSVVAAIRPDLVHFDLMEPGLVDPPELDIVLGGLRAITPNGVLGDPTGANGELGEVALRYLAEMLRDEVVAAEPGG